MAHITTHGAVINTLCRPLFIAGTEASHVHMLPPPPHTSFSNIRGKKYWRPLKCEQEGGNEIPAVFPFRRAIPFKRRPAEMVHAANRIPLRPSCTTIGVRFHMPLRFHMCVFDFVENSALRKYVNGFHPGVCGQLDTCKVHELHSPAMRDRHWKALLEVTERARGDGGRRNSQVRTAV